MNEQPSGLVRILVAGATAGTGFLVSGDGLIVTCTHVVGETHPNGSVSVAFRFGAQAVEAREALVVASLTRPVDAEDIAFLRLREPVPDGVVALPIGSSRVALGGTYRTFGFPDAKPVDGMAGMVEVTGRTLDGGYEVLQLRSNEVSRGYSGAPVWDEQGAAIGMVMSVVRPDPLGRQSEVSFVRPIEELIRVCPDLRPQLAPPYRGLEVFEEEHADDYFGRERASGELLDKLAAHDFVAVVGVSGCGKSSLVRAGLRKGLARSAVPGLVKRSRCLLVPGSAPMLDLALALAALPGVGTAKATRALGLSTRALDDPERSLRDAGDELGRREPDELAHAIRGLVSGGLLVIVDQFERLFTETHDEAARGHFIDTLLAVASDDVKVVITLRADFYGLALTHPGVDVLLADGQLTLSPMTDDELVQAIEEPARRRGRGCEAGLAQRLIADVKGRPGDLPLLEFALVELWDRDADSGVLKVATYDRQLGYQGPDGETYPGVQGAIAKRAEQLWNDLEPDERTAARRVFLSVVGAAATGGEGGSPEVASSRRAWLLELGVTERAVAEKLATARLLTTGRDAYSGQATIEVAHEALIRAWPLLGRWTTTFRPFVRWRDGELAPLWQRWVAHDRDPQLLLPFSMLDEARRWKEQYEDELSPAHVEYIHASIEAFDAHTARREVELARTKRLNRRLRILASGLGASFLVAALATILAVIQTGETRREARIGTSRLLSVEADARATSDPALSILLSLAAFNSDDTAQARHSLQSQIVRQHHVRRILTGRSGPIEALAYSPDGRMLAAGGAAGITVWDQPGRTPPARLLQPTGTVRAVSFSRDGSLLAAGGDKGVAVWDMTRPDRPRLRRAWRDRAGTLAMSPDGRRIAFAGLGPTLTVQDVAGGRKTIRVPGSSRIDGLAMTPDSRRVVAVGDGAASVWNLATRSRERRFRFDIRARGTKTGLALTADGRTLATYSGTKTELWDLAGGTKLNELSSTVDPLPLAFRPDGEALAVTEDSVGEGTKIVAYRVTAKGVVKNSFVDEELLVGARPDASGLVYSPDGRTLASGSKDGTVTLWDPAAGTVGDAKLRSIDTVALDSKGATIALDGHPRTRDGTGALSFVDVARGRTILHMPCMRFAGPRPHTSMWVVAAADCGGGLAVMDPSRRRGQRRVALLRPRSEYRRRAFSEGARFSPDGRLVAEQMRPYRRLAPGKFTLSDKELLLWDARKPGAPLAQLEVAPPEILFSQTPAESFAFSPDGRTLAIGRSYDRSAMDVGDDARVLLWDTRRRRTNATIRLGSYVHSVAFNPSGTVLAAGLKDRVELWRLSDRTRVGVIDDIRGSAKQLAFTPDGERLVVADSEGVRLWSVDPISAVSVQLPGDQGPDSFTAK